MSNEKLNPLDINKESVDKKILLDELASDIARKFWIEKEKTKQLIKADTLSWIDSLKRELVNEKKNLSDNEIEKLFFTLKWALEIITNTSKLEIKSLKEDVENSIKIDEIKNKIEDYLPANLIYKAKNPEKLHEHILWFALWSANSIYTTVEILYKIWIWIIKAPYDLYMIISWKAETDSFKDI